MNTTPVRPLVSVVMANYRGAEHLPAAMASVLGQSLEALELIVSDDCSDDESLTIAEDLARRDGRVRVVAASRNAGPGAARNRALALARGDWIAIVDSDDLIHPERFQRMLAAAGALGADIMADDLVLFGEQLGAGGRTLLQVLGLTAPRPVGIGDYLRAGGEGMPPLGYLKPMIRRTAIGQLRYNEDMPVGEDYDFCVRLIAGGARMWILPDPTYLYRRHAGSVSHRLTVRAAAGILTGIDRLPAPTTAEERRLRAAWRRSVARQHRYAELVAAIKARRPGAALRRLIEPAMLFCLWRSLNERRARGREDRQAPPRLPSTVRLGQQKAAAPGALALQVPPIPAPADSWERAPAEFAAALSSLWSRYELKVEPTDAAGDWARWLIPSSYGGDP